LEEVDEHHPEAFRNIMRHGPAGGVRQLSISWVQRPQVGDVRVVALIGRSV
jgi:hypothetical protein